MNKKNVAGKWTLLPATKTRTAFRRTVVMNVHYSRGRGDSSSGYVGAIEPHLVGIYEAPPQEELSMKEFEQLSFNRLTGM